MKGEALRSVMFQQEGAKAAKEAKKSAKDAVENADEVGMEGASCGGAGVL